MKPCSNLFIESCVKCRGENKPYIVKVENMYYVRCPCGKWDRYTFLGLTQKSAWESWNAMNRPIQRGRYNPKDQ